MEGQMTDHYTTEDKTMPTVCYALYLAGFVTGGLTAIVGVIIAYAQQTTAGPDMRTHYTFLIRTFWIGLVWSILAGLVLAVGIPLSFILIGIPLLILAKLMFAVGAVWFGLRCILGLIQVSRAEAYPRPYAVLA
jgi:uncharacterized membrane protein